MPILSKAAHRELARPIAFLGCLALSAAVPLAAAALAAGESVLDHGAKCDGVADDLPALNAAVAAHPSGGVVVLPNRRCRITQAWVVRQRNLEIRGSGPASEIYLDASGAFPRDRAIQVTGSSSPDRAVTGSIAAGTTSFTGAATGDLVPGDWLQVSEFDAKVGDIAYFDWVQVAAVAGSTVHVVEPFRVAFPAHGQVNYRRVTNTASGIVLRDFGITTSGSPNQVGLNVQMAREVTVENVRSSSGKAFAFYRTRGVRLANSRQVRSYDQTTEFAACVDLVVIGNVFGTDGNTGGVTLDLGTAFFAFTRNEVHGVNAGIGLHVHVHDGTVADNTVGRVGLKGQAAAGGIVSRGSERVLFRGNRLEGGAGKSVGIDVGDENSMAHDVRSSGNVVVGNTILGFASPHGTRSPRDVYLPGPADAPAPRE